MLSSVLFLALTASAGWFAFRGFSRVRRNIFLGKDEIISGDSSLRWKNMFLVALGQQKMFKN
ncbi:MAG: Fe-S oxidoreductase, partial [Bacteroidota bacterium]